MKSQKHQIIVGNIGMVYCGDSAAKANDTYDEYVEQSRTNYGRAAGESVSWFKNDELVAEYAGTVKGDSE